VFNTFDLSIGGISEQTVNGPEVIRGYETTCVSVRKPGRSQHIHLA